MDEQTPQGMIIDGVAASEAIDSSGEVLDIKGADISSLEEGDAVLNYEHADPKRQGASFNDVIGRIISAKKIFSAADCANDRERMYWDKTKLPFIYIQAELFDADGHPGAVAAAAMIRHYAARGLPILVRFSIEGSTIEKDGNRLVRTVARAVAATIKPCNKTAQSGVISDPEARKGGEPKTVLKFENPEKMRLSSVEIESIPVVSDPEWTVVTDALAKTMTAGFGGGAPGSRTQGSALQKAWEENPSLRYEMLAALRDFNGLGKAEFRSFLKARLPEADDEYLDYFADMVDEFEIRKSLDRQIALLKKEGEEVFEGGWKRDVGKHPSRFVRKPSDRPTGPDVDPYGNLVGWAPGYPGAPTEQTAAFREDPSFTPSTADVTDTPYARRPPARPRKHPPGVRSGYTIGGKPAPSHRYHIGKTEVRIDGDKLITPGGVVTLRSYSTSEEEDAILSAIQQPKIMNLWLTAMTNWSQLHATAKEGSLSPLVVAHASLFSLLSPNTPVPVNELMYAHLVDSINAIGYGPWEAKWGEREILDYLRRDNPSFAPTHAGHLFEEGGDISPHVRLKDSTLDRLSPRGVIPGRKEGDFGGFGLVNSKVADIVAYRRAHPFLVGQQQRLAPRLDEGVGQEWVSTLMSLRDYSRWRTTKAAREGEPWATSEGEPLAPGLPGMGVKILRFIALLSGMGDTLVPDVHFMRHIFGFHLNKDMESFRSFEAIMGSDRNAHLWDDIDRHFAETSPVYKWIIKNKEQYFPNISNKNLIGPAFWLTWMGIVDFELKLGLRDSRGPASNEESLHEPFFTSVSKILSDFDLATLTKSESSLPLYVRTAQAQVKLVEELGETGALIAYFTNIAPVLMAHGSYQKSEDNLVRSLEGLTASLSKAAEDILPPLSREAPPAGTKFVRGQYIIPGEVEFITGAFTGVRVPYYFRNATHTFIAPPTDPSSPEMQKILNKHEGRSYRINRAPEKVYVPTLIDANEDCIPGVGDEIEYKMLVHGIDVTADAENAPSHVKPGQTALVSWRKTPSGKTVLLKPALEPDETADFLTQGGAFSTAMREAVFHHATEKALGLHGYVPKTTAFTHPVTREEYSAQEAIIGFHVEAKATSQTRDILVELGDAGVLDILALVDYIFGNRDRGPTNYLLSKADQARIHLIDNAFSFAYGDDPVVPDYLVRYWAFTGHDNPPLHPSAIEWARSLDPERLPLHLLEYGVPPNLVGEATSAAMKVKAVATALTEPRIWDIYDLGYQLATNKVFEVLSGLEG